MARMKRRSARFQQGQFDRLCGIYAIINSLRWALRHRKPPVDEDVWSEVFGELCHDLDQQIGLMRGITEGIATAAMGRLIKIAQDWLWDFHGIDTTANKPLIGRGKRPFWEIFEAMCDHLDSPETSIVTGIGESPCHWTVIIRASTANLRLWDSTGRSAFPAVKCSMKGEARYLPGNRYIIGVRSTWFVSA